LYVGVRKILDQLIYRLGVFYAKISDGFTELKRFTNSPCCGDLSAGWLVGWVVG